MPAAALQTTNTNEQQRLDALYGYKVLDTPPEPVFDELTQLAADICGTTIALISLVDIDRQWFKSKVGIAIAETPRYMAFCDRVIRHKEFFAVRDALTDTCGEDFFLRQFANNPLVCGEPYIRFYAGVPLINRDGFVLGTLCVMDSLPRDLSSQQIKALQVLSRQVVTQLEVRRNNTSPKRTTKSRKQTEKKLQKTRAELEIQVKARTAELEKINADLQEKLASYQQREAELEKEKEFLRAVIENKQESERRFSTIVNTASEGIWLLDARGSIAYVNQRMSEMLGYTTSEMLGRSWFDFMDETARAIAKQNWEPRQQVSDSRCEFRFRRKDNSTVWTIGSTNPLLGESGELLGTIGMITDISYRVRNEDALRRYTQRLEGIHEISRAILAEKSPEEIARTAMRHLRGLIPCQEATVMLFNFERGEVRSFAGDADSNLVFPEGTMLPIEDFFPIDIKNDTVRYVADIAATQSNPRILQRLISAGIRCCLSVPLIVEGVRIGELSLADTTPGAFDLESVAIAQEVAGQVAIAIANARLFEQVRASWRALTALSGRLMEAQETERRHIAHELHDQIGQALTALKINLQVLQRLPDAEARPSYLQESISIVEDTLGQVRNLSLDLRPSMLDDLGLVAALRWYVDRHAQRSGLVEEFVADLPESRLPANIEIACFRIVQEALTNVVRHALAKRVSVTLQQYNKQLHLVIRDDGVGFDVAAARKRSACGGSLGLLGMEERALLVGGEIKVASTPKLGTKICVRFPLD